MGRWLLFIYYLHFYKLSYFFGLPKFLSDLISQKDHFMVSQRIIHQVGCVQIDLSNMSKWSN
jgi:hypothetical protein